MAAQSIAYHARSWNSSALLAQARPHDDNHLTSKIGVIAVQPTQVSAITLMSYGYCQEHIRTSD